MMSNEEPEEDGGVGETDDEEGKGEMSVKKAGEIGGQKVKHWVKTAEEEEQQEGQEGRVERNEGENEEGDNQ